jgi:hypothetical protein
MAAGSTTEAVQLQLMGIADIDLQLREMELKVQRAKAELQQTDSELSRRRKEWELRAGGQLPQRWKKILRGLTTPAGTASPLLQRPSSASWKALSRDERQLIRDNLKNQHHEAEQLSKRHEYEIADLNQKIAAVEKQIELEDEATRQLEAAQAKLAQERKYFEEEVYSREIAATLQRKLQEEAEQIARDEEIARSLNTFTCHICGEEYPMDDAFVLDCCSSIVCREDMRQQVEVNVGEGKAQISCPMNCKAIVPQAQYFMVATEEIQMKILSLELNQVQQSKEFTFCRAADCRGTRCLEDLGAGQSTCPDHFVCPVDSKHQWCLKCDCIWHEKVTCEKYQEWKKDNANADAETDKLIAQMGWKRCPNCRNAVEKAAGCNAMRCRCGCAFCYRCNFNAGVGGDAHHGCG